MNAESPDLPTAPHDPVPSGPPPSAPASVSDAPEPGAPAAEGAAADAESGDGVRRRRRRRRRRRHGEGDDAGRGEAGGTSGDVDAGGDAGAGDAATGESASADPTAGGGDAAAPAERRRKKRRKKKKVPAAEAAPPPPAREPQAGRRPRRAEFAPRRPEQQGAVAVRALSEMARALLDAEGIDPFGRPRWLELRLRVPLDPDRDSTRAANDIVQQLLARVDDVRRHEGALKPGSVYCYFTDSAAAPSSRPQLPREVFDGFGSTGRPKFSDFVTLAIERRDQGIDELVNGEDLVVTHVSMGRVLRTQQLQEFGAESPIYRILGQVDAGLYPMLGSEHKAAFSFQLLRGTTLDGTPRFRLHWVGAAEVRDIADPMVGAILKRFQQRLDRESLRFAGILNNGTPPDEEEFVLPLLQELSKQLAGRARRAGRRTEHATQRSDDRQRPTAKAWDDARDVADDRILRDDEQGTVVVIGAKNRVHVFSFDAKHVTSFVMSGGHVQKRVQEGRWHPAEPEERGEFRIALKRRIGAGETEVAEDGATPAG